MEWTIDYLSKENLLFIKTRGIMTRDSANTYVKEVFETANRHQCDRQLVDHRETAFSFSIHDYYERPGINQQLGLSHRWRIAMVFKEMDENTNFMETVFRNRGYNFRQFDNIDEARTWVLGND